MNLTLRQRFMRGLLGLIAVIYLLLGAALFAFNLWEQRHHPDEIVEEAEELLIIYGLMAGVLPVAGITAWLLTEHWLQPLRGMLRTARAIGEGGLDQRIETPVASDELGQLAVTLNEAFDNYRRVLQRIDRFSLDAAHQLRNPLAALRTASEVCLQRERSPAQYREALGAVIEQTRRLGHTVDQLLLLARLARTDLQRTFEWFDLAELARNLADHLRPAFEAAHVRLQTRLPSTPQQMHGAPRLLEQALANLLDNALRFTPAAGHVLLELQSAPPRLLLRVADSGPGLPSPRTPASATSHDTPNPVTANEGNGLGLLIVRDVARAHGGSLQATVSEWGGAGFTLDLPATPSGSRPNRSR